MWRRLSLKLESGFRGFEGYKVEGPTSQGLPRSSRIPCAERASNGHCDTAANRTKGEVTEYAAHRRGPAEAIDEAAQEADEVAEEAAQEAYDEAFDQA